MVILNQVTLLMNWFSRSTYSLCHLMQNQNFESYIHKSEKEAEMVQRIQRADYPESEFHPYPLPSSSTPLKRWRRR